MSVTLKKVVKCFIPYGILALRHRLPPPPRYDDRC